MGFFLLIVLFTEFIKHATNFHVKIDHLSWGSIHQSMGSHNVENYWATGDWCQSMFINTLRPKQNGRHFADYIF